MRSHASWGSLNDVMLVFMNKDAYDKFRLSKEDYELQKELEKEQKKNAEKADTDKKKGKKKDDKKADKKEEKKDIDVQLDGIEDRIVRITPNSSEIADAIVVPMEKVFTTCRLSKRDTTFGNSTCAKRALNA